MSMYNANNYSFRSARSLRKIINQSGFSLIELMIAVAIVGIIAAISYPSYLGHVNKVRRADGHLALMNAVQVLEQCQAQDFIYTNCQLPTQLQTSDEGFYAITVATSSDAFTLTATAQESQAGDSKCPTITLTDKGERGFTGSGPCW